jgi:hypothetical protein
MGNDDLDLIHGVIIAGKTTDVIGISGIAS